MLDVVLTVVVVVVLVVVVVHVCVVVVVGLSHVIMCLLTNDSLN
jgi:hypothetical protein